MAAVIRAYLWLLNAMAWAAAAMLVATLALIIYWVVWRNIGWQPWSVAYDLTSYAMLYIPMLGAPWLVRRKGHVHIELLTAALPERPRRLLSRVTALICVVTCGLLAWHGVEITLKDIARNAMDVRAFYYPRWIVVVVMPVSFAMMAVEFMRFVVGADDLHTGEAGIHE